MAIVMKTQLKNDLKVLIQHAWVDLGFRGEGSYSDIDKDGERVFTEKEGRQAKRALAFLDQLIAIS